MIIPVEIHHHGDKMPLMPMILPRWRCAVIWRKSKRLNDNQLYQDFDGAA